MVKEQLDVCNVTRSKMVLDAKIVRHLMVVLRQADLTITTTTKIRQQL